MHRTTIMLSARLWEDVKGCAEDQGISASQYVREATQAAVFLDKGVTERRFGAPFEKARKELRK